MIVSREKQGRLAGNDRGHAQALARGGIFACRRGAALRWSSLAPLAPPLRTYKLARPPISSPADALSREGYGSVLRPAMASTSGLADDPTLFRPPPGHTDPRNAAFDVRDTPGISEYLWNVSDSDPRARKCFELLNYRLRHAPPTDWTRLTPDVERLMAPFERLDRSGAVVVVAWLWLTALGNPRQVTGRLECAAGRLPRLFACLASARLTCPGMTTS